MDNIFRQIDFEAIGDFFYKIFVEDFLTKLFVLLLTLIVWSFIILKNNYTTTLSVPLKITNIDQGKVLKSTAPSSVKAKFKGNGMDFFLLLLQSESTFRMNLNLSTIEWFYNFDLNKYFRTYPENISVPRNSDVKFLNIVKPDSLKIELGRLSQKKVAVKPNLDVTLPSGYVKYEPEVNPDSVLLKGPKSYLDDLHQIGTDTLKKDRVMSTVLETVDVQQFKDKNIKIRPSRVKIYQEIDQIGEKVVSGVPVKVKNSPQNKKVKIYPPKVSVFLTGGFEKIKNIKTSDINIILNFKGQSTPNKKYYKPQTSIAKEKVDIREIRPPEIEVRFIEKGDEE